MFSIERNKAHNLLYFLVRVILWIVLKPIFRVDVQGSSNISKDEGFILCSNHMSYADPVFLCAFFPRYLYFMAKIELFKNKQVAAFVSFFNTFPVNRSGKDIRSIKTSIKVLKGNRVLGIFPEGTRSTDGKILEGQKGISFIALKSSAKILPVAISGTNKIVQKPHKRLFFPKVRIKYGKPIDTMDLFEKHGKKKAEVLIVEETMSSIKDIYQDINK